MFPRYFTEYLRLSFAIAGMVLMLLPCQAQPLRLSIRETMSLVQSNQPQLLASKERATAAGYNKDLARNTLTPDLTVSYQADYATYNNITGMSYAGQMQPITGPVVASNIYDPVPGTALTALLKWEPFTFGQRQAAVDRAAAEYRLAVSEYDEAVFRQEYMALNVYLDIVYLKKLLTSLEANRDRTLAVLQQSLVLAKEGLRPGIDTAQLQAALAQSEIDLLNTQRSCQVQVIELTRLTGLQELPEHIIFTDTIMAEKMPLLPDSVQGFKDHPLYHFYQAKRDAGLSTLKEVERSWRPHLDFWANVYARGSGVASDGTVNKTEGWSLTRNNYGTGLQLSWPILQFSRFSLSKRQYRSFLKADEAQLAQAGLDLSKQTETAMYNYRQNRLIAMRAPVITRSQQFVYKGLQLSYESGLIDYTRLIQGQYDLEKSEIVEAGARIQVWRSLLEVAVATGHLSLFTDEIVQP